VTPSAADPDAAALIAARPALRMHVRDGLLLEDAPLAAIAAEHGTPTWVYGAGTLRARARLLTQAFPGIAVHYALKANDHLAVLAVLRCESLGADIVSAGEMMRAVKAGFPAARTVFSGVGKTRQDLERALASRLGQINVESAEELQLVSDVGRAEGVRVPVALRVNPDVDAGTHDKISTGRKGDKFGIPLQDIPSLYEHAARLPGIDLRGLAVHIGSQVLALAPYRAAYGKLAALVRALRAQGLGVHTVDCGGGLAVPYRNETVPLPEAWAATITNAFAGLDLALSIEPGRWIAAPAGILLTRVIRTRRHGMVRPLHIVDAAMNDLARPAMYGAWHGVVPVSPIALQAAPEAADMAGPVCESGDFLAHDRLIPPLEDDSLVAILDVGAYGAVMSSSYNARPAAAQVMVDAGTAALIRPRQAVEDLWRTELVPNRGS
jgi:diaminopimelate decarboxylase